MGSGKTKACVQFIRNLPKDASILYISARRTLCNDIYEKYYKGLGFTYYTKLYRADLNRVVTCINSIHKLFKLKMNYDYIIMDEYTQALYQLFALKKSDFQ